MVHSRLLLRFSLAFMYILCLMEIYVTSTVLIDILIVLLLYVISLF